MRRRTVVAAVIVVVAVLVGVIRGWGPSSPSTTAEPTSTASPASASPSASASAGASSAAVSPTPSAPTPSVPPAAEPTAEPGDLDATPEATSEAEDATPGPVPYSQTAAARRAWEPVVVGFGRNFTRADRGATAWRAGLRPYTTAAVQKDLAVVDVGDVPPGTYDSYEVLEYDDEQVAAQVLYREGWSAVLYVIFDGEKWRVFRYDRWEE